MFDAIKVVDIELSEKVTDITELDGYVAVKGLVRLYGTPLGYIQLPVTNNCCQAKQILNVTLAQHNQAITRELLNNGLAAPASPDRLSLEKLLETPPPTFEGPFPLVTVAVCTRDRTADLEQCLQALLQLEYPNLECIIVDNAPSNDATKQLVDSQYPQMRYVCEPRPGLDWARNRAIIEAKGDIIAYTDDDVIVDSGWATAIAQLFAENPDVMAVTGLVVPYELETKAQILFEMSGGFGRGFEQRWYRIEPKSGSRWQYFGTGQYGTGANMAYRRELFEQIGYFDPALDVGTVTNGGGDLEMFFRVLKEGHTLVYEPRAIVRHRHRREYPKLVSQIRNNGIGLYSYFVRSTLAYPKEGFSFLKLGLWWLWWWSIRRLIGSFIRPTRLPRELIIAELTGSFIGLTRYQKAAKSAAMIKQKFGPHSQPQSPAATGTQPYRRRKQTEGIGVRVVELSQPVADLVDIEQYQQVRLFFTYRDRPLGSIDIVNNSQPVSASRIREQLVNKLDLKMFHEIPDYINSGTFWADALLTLNRRFLNSALDTGTPDIAELSNTIPVSIVIATLDRPDDLHQCLTSLMAQKTNRPVEVVVVDNNPASGLTPPVTAQFPNVKLVNESRKGLAYARNAGFIACSGDIAIATDDDVILPENWLERMVTPFTRHDVMAVTGNVLPFELETHSQQFFEMYGGLGRGFKSFDVNGDWFESFRFFSTPTWELGATANAAFRTTIFTHPDIGLMDEALGPGMPSGVGEDTYLFYKVIKAGYTIYYEPGAYVWHKHRRTDEALRRQIYGYSKGHVAYNVTTFVQDGDFRGIIRVVVGLPMYYLWRLYTWLRRRTDYPISLTMLELKGSLQGFGALWQSWRRVKREGHSQPYIPASKHLASIQNNSLVEPHLHSTDAHQKTNADIP